MAKTKMPIKQVKPKLRRRQAQTPYIYIQRNIDKTDIVAIYSNIVGLTSINFSIEDINSRPELTKEIDARIRSGNLKRVY